EVPELGEQADLERLAQIHHALGAARAALEADDALDRRQVAETPLREAVLEVDELLGELVEVPVLLGVAVDLQPSLLDALVVLGGPAPGALEPLGRDLEAPAG